jgi:hypothetical protein
MLNVLNVEPVQVLTNLNDYPVWPEQAQGDDSDYKRNPYSPV